YLPLTAIHLHIHTPQPIICRSNIWFYFRTLRSFNYGVGDLVTWVSLYACPGPPGHIGYSARFYFCKGDGDYNASEYKGIDLDAFLDMSTNEMVKLFPAKAHRR
ncbi:hypothetical protein DVH24_033614, partial [Malus domestica]